MENTDLTHYVFVDFENVPNVDLRLIEGKSVKVALLIGKNQKKLDLARVQQIQRQAAKVVLIEVGASGHNALDLTLGYYLGQAVLTAPQAQFLIVSNDKDFDPLIAHLLGQGVRVCRQGEFSAQLFAPAPRKALPVKSAAPAVRSSPPADPLAKLVARLQNPASPRPVSRARLFGYVRTAYGNKLTEPAVHGLVDDLVKRGVLAIDGQGKVSY